MASYKLTQAAKNDLTRIYLYGLERFGEAQADKYYMELIGRFEDIAAYPQRFPIYVDQPDYRRSILGQDVVYYRVIDGIVEITAILGKQDHEGWL